MRIAAGEQGVAPTFRPDIDVATEFDGILHREGGVLDWSGERLLHAVVDPDAETRPGLVLDLLRRLS
jgi:hypothetical protein